MSALLKDRKHILALQHVNVRDEIRLLGGAAPDSSVYERDGIFAAVVPSLPHQTMVNTVTYEPGACLLDGLDGLTKAYDAAGVSSWRVWVPEHDPDTGAALEAKGYRLAARYPFIVLDLAAYEPPDLTGFVYDAEGDMATLGRVNALAYENGQGLTAALRTTPPGLDVHLYQAHHDGHPATVRVCVDHLVDGQLDNGAYFGATVPAARGKGLARMLGAATLVDARARGCVTSSAVSSAMGLPVWTAMGYRPVLNVGAYEPRPLRPS
ncbi:hypothetical protein ACF06X_34385 [Streptomyces sp. NPDC015346]|uniref:hypothetical protein n=1 Tax=Streptomyces sp. NPDC015346 TaxID=3364954 RepID=UPI003702647E